MVMLDSQYKLHCPTIGYCLVLFDRQSPCEPDELSQWPCHDNSTVSISITININTVNLIATEREPWCSFRRSSFCTSPSITLLSAALCSDPRKWQYLL